LRGLQRSWVWSSLRAPMLDCKCSSHSRESKVREPQNSSGIVCAHAPWQCEECPAEPRGPLCAAGCGAHKFDNIVRQAARQCARTLIQHIISGTPNPKKALSYLINNVVLATSHEHGRRPCRAGNIDTARSGTVAPDDSASLEQRPTRRHGGRHSWRWAAHGLREVGRLRLGVQAT